MSNLMKGEMDLSKMLATLEPKLLEGDYVFCTMVNGRYGDYQALKPMATFQEAEGLTLVIPKARADKQGIPYEAVFRRITLMVHSSLEAVGLTAAFAAKLTEKGISANVIAAYYHDHIFVQAARAEDAMAALGELTK